MALTAEQLTTLRNHLTTRVHLDYAHLHHELLSHYATLTEENITAGLSFSEAQAAAWQALGADKGIRQIQMRYEQVTRRQLAYQHRMILKSLLRWPTLVSTLLTMGLLSYLLLTLPPYTARIIACILTGSPILIIAVAAARCLAGKDSRQKLPWQYVISIGSIPIHLLTLINLYISLTGQEPSRVLLMVLFVLALGSLYLTFSLAQLVREHFSFRLT